jgi:hypothetical protein
MLTAQMFGAEGCGCGFGDFAGAAAADLQNQLKGLAVFKGDTRLDPRRYDGVVDLSTLAALFNAATWLPSNVPGIGTVLSKIGWIKSKLGDIPGVGSIVNALFNPATATSTWEQIKAIAVGVKAIPGIGPRASTAVNDINSAFNTAYGAIDSNAQAISAAVGAILLVKPPSPPPIPGTVTVTSTPPPSTPGTAVTAIFLRPAAGGAAAPGAAPGTAPAPQAYPPGTIAAFSVKLGKYRIAIPKTALYGVAGLGVTDDRGCCISGDCGLGQTHTEVAPGATLPPGAKQVAEEELDKATKPTPFYKKWWFWTAIGGAAAVGGGTFYYVRRKKVVK